MSVGYIALQTHPEHPGLVRVVTLERVPEAKGGHLDGDLRYILLYSNAFVARMHIHEGLRRRLVDIDQGLYRCDLGMAMAVCDTVAFHHKRVWQDPSVSEDTLASRAEWRARLEKRHAWRARVWRWVGWAFVFLFLLLSFAPL